jgi:hypothetical protein
MFTISPAAAPATVTVTVTTQEILPELGLAFVVDDRNTTWGISRHIEGPGLHTLERGQRLQVQLQRYAGFSLVQAYRAVDPIAPSA